jgi:hypothetical protein
MYPTVQRSSEQSGGFVQMMVLVGLATIGAIVSAAIVSSQDGARSEAALERLVLVDALTTSGFNRLAAAMRDPSDNLETQALDPKGVADTFVADITVTLQIEGISGKIDVLRTDRNILARYLSNSALSSNEQTALLASIDKARASRDADAAIDLVFAALLDLRPLSALERDFTKFGSGAGIDPTYASGRVLAAVPGLSAADVARWVSSSAMERTQLKLQSPYFATNGTRFDLVAQVSWAPDQSVERRLPVELTTGGHLIPIAGPN